VADGAGEPAAPEHLIVGHISKAHGTKGEVYVWPLTDEPTAVFARHVELLLGDEEGRLDDASETLVIEEARLFKRGVLVKFAGFADRSAVDDLAGRYLLAATAALRPLEAGELFYHQLLGMHVETVDGQPVGVVREVYEMEPADMLEVRSGSGTLHLIPFLERIVRQVDVAGRRLVIEPPPGLLEI
jgi:16S rRNA processing protein RimM